jgi:hypothetical protein
VTEQVKHVVLEYEVVAYHPPEDFFEAMGASYAVRFAGVPVQGDDLSEAREDLVGKGYTLHGAQMLKSRACGRYAPTWREVWVCCPGATHQGNV